VLFWPAPIPIERAAAPVGKAARVEKRELDQFRRPLAGRLEETRTVIERVQAPSPEGMSGLFDDEAFPAERGRHPVLRQGAGGLDLATRGGALDQCPPELRAPSSEAIARQRHITDS
jgi:hypothetical protein